MGSVNEKVLITESDIAVRVGELAKEIKDYYGPIDNLLLVGILTGAYKFLGDLSAALGKLGLPHEIAFMGVRSYENSETTNGAPRITLDIERPIHNKHVLVVEDIKDTGYTVEKLLQVLETRGPESLEFIALLAKQERAEVDVPVKWIGFEIPNKYVYGYGIDDGHQAGRERSDIVYID